MVKHPAPYSDVLLPIIAKELLGYSTVYDPFGGTGKIAAIKDLGFEGKIYCCDIEPEWTNKHQGVDTWIISDCSYTPFLKDNFFDAVCTSPTYGNRMADHFTPKDNSRRATYRIGLGRDLNTANTGRMVWGDPYRKKTIECYTEILRVLKPNGKFVLNVSDHIKAGDIVPVTAWHTRILIGMGLQKITDINVPTKRMRFGANSNLRVSHESIIIFEKIEDGWWVF